MIKKLFLFIALAAVSAALCACVRETPAPAEEPPATPDAALPIENETDAATLSPFADLAGLSPQDVAYICRFDDSAAPDTPSVKYASDADVEEALRYLKSIRPTERIGAQAQDIPGDGVSFRLCCFDGKELEVVFSADAVRTPNGYYAYETGSSLPDTGGFRLIVPQSAYPADTEEIPAALINDTGRDALFRYVPTLERMDADGWWKLQPRTGFCGTPDPLPAGRTDLENAAFLPAFDAASGVYRLSMQIIDTDGNEYTVSDVFSLTD